MCTRLDLVSLFLNLFLNLILSTEALAHQEGFNDLKCARLNDPEINCVRTLTTSAKQRPGNEERSEINSGFLQVYPEGKDETQERADTIEEGSARTESAESHNRTPEKLEIALSAKSTKPMDTKRIGITDRKVQQRVLNKAKLVPHGPKPARTEKPEFDLEPSLKPVSMPPPKRHMYDEDNHLSSHVFRRSPVRGAQQGKDIIESGRKFGFSQEQAHNILQGVGERLKANQVAAQHELSTQTGIVLKDGRLCFNAYADADAYGLWPGGRRPTVEQRQKSAQTYSIAWEALQQNFKYMKEAQKALRQKRQDIGSILRVDTAMARRMKLTFQPLQDSNSKETVAAAALASTRRRKDWVIAESDSWRRHDSGMQANTLRTGKRVEGRTRRSDRPSKEVATMKKLGASPDGRSKKTGGRKGLRSSERSGSGKGV